MVDIENNEEDAFYHPEGGKVLATALPPYRMPREY